MFKKMREFLWDCWVHFDRWGGGSFAQTTAEKKELKERIEKARRTGGWVAIHGRRY